MHDGQIKADHQGSELADARPGSLDAVDFPRDGHLVTLLVGVGAIRVGEVDVAVGLRHDAPYRVPALNIRDHLISTRLRSEGLFMLSPQSPAARDEPSQES